MLTRISFALCRSAIAAALSLATLGAHSAASAENESARLEGASAAEKQTPNTEPRFRKLAPGVERTIDPERRVEETFSHHDVVELLAVDPKFDWAKNVIFRHDVADLEFTYKPMRFIEVDVPDANGKLQRETVWYLVYRVRNTGDKPVRFYPRFTLETDDPPVAYADQLIPTAIPLIERREDAARRLLNTVQIAGEIAPSPPGKELNVWGVVTWAGVDPHTDRFAVYVGGLSTAYRWQELPDGTRKRFYKTLRLDYWRPSDEFHEHESEIRAGLPNERIDYEWVYR